MIKIKEYKVDKCLKWGTYPTALIILMTLGLLASLFRLPIDAQAQSISDYDQASSFCRDTMNGRVVSTTAGGGGAFNCITTAPGDSCDRFRPPEGQSGCIVVPSTSIVGRTQNEARGLFVASAASTSTGQSNIDRLLATGVNIMTGAAGLAIVGSIVVGGIQYSSAGGNAAQVSSAKNRIVVSLASLLMLGFGFAILQWLIPGGVFNT